MKPCLFLRWTLLEDCGGVELNFMKPCLFLRRGSMYLCIRSSEYVQFFLRRNALLPKWKSFPKSRSSYPMSKSLVFRVNEIPTASYRVSFFFQRWKPLVRSTAIWNREEGLFGAEDLVPFLRPLEKNGYKGENRKEVTRNEQLVDLPSSISHVSLLNQSLRSTQMIQSPEKNEETSNCSSFAGSGFTLWEETFSREKALKGKMGHCTSLVDFNSVSSSLSSGINDQSFMRMINYSNGVEGTSIKKEASSCGEELPVQVDRRCNDHKANTPRSKHSATEQRRRSKINDRFVRLRNLIPHGDQKRDKASFLLEVIEYIQFLHNKLRKYEGSNLSLVDPKQNDHRKHTQSSVEQVRANMNEARTPLPIENNVAAIWNASSTNGFTPKLKDPEMTIDGGTINISSAYSQGLLNSLTLALQNSGVDLSQASISVQVDLGKRSSIIKDMGIQSGPMALSRVSSSQPHQKRLKMSRKQS